MLHLRFRQLAFAALTGFVVIPLAWAPRQATAMHSSPSDLVQPHIMRELSADEAKAPTTVLLPPSPTPVVPLAPRTPNGPQREVFGFVQASVMGDAGVGYPSWDFSMLTTVAYFGVHVNWDGHLVTNDNGWYWWNSGTLTNLVNAAHSHGVKVVLTIILQDGSGGQNLMCSGLGGMDNTVSDGVREIAAKGVDGINLDYEGQNAPCFNNGFQVGTTQSMLIAFVQKMRSAMTTGARPASASAAPMIIQPVPWRLMDTSTPRASRRLRTPLQAPIRSTATSTMPSARSVSTIGSATSTTARDSSTGTTSCR